MSQTHSHRRPQPQEGREVVDLYPDDGHDEDDGGGDRSLSAIPREILVRKRIDAGSTSTSRPTTRKKPPSADSAGGITITCTCTGRSRSSDSAGARLRSFFARKSSKLRVFRPKDREHRISKRRKEAHVHVADEGHTRDVDLGGHNADGRNAACDENEVRAVARGAPADTAQMPPAPPSYEEALRLGLFNRPAQQEGLQQSGCARLQRS